MSEGTEGGRGNCAIRGSQRQFLRVEIMISLCTLFVIERSEVFEKGMFVEIQEGECVARVCTEIG